MGEYRILRAGIDDIMHIHDMAEIVFRHTYKDILSPEQMEYMMDWMYSPENLQKQLEDGHVYHIAFRDNVPCGYVSVQPDGINEEGRLRYHLQKIYVLPNFQRRGIGDALFSHAEDYIRASYSSPWHLRLNVNRANSAQGFYRRRGLTIEETGDFDIGNGFFMNDYIMGKWL